MRRRALLLFAAMAVVGLLALVGRWALTAEARRVAELVAPQVDCPASRLRVVAVAQSDTAEIYEFEGCGKRGPVMCLAPDFQCTAMEGPRP